jgi:hypothetical protein
VSVPADRQVIGAVHSQSVVFAGQNSSSQGQLSYGGWTTITSTYDFYYYYALQNPDLSYGNRTSIPVASSAANVTDAWRGCQVVGVNAS